MKWRFWSTIRTHQERMPERIDEWLVVPVRVPPHHGPKRFRENGSLHPMHPLRRRSEPACAGGRSSIEVPEVRHEIRRGRRRAWARLNRSRRDGSERRLDSRIDETVRFPRSPGDADGRRRPARHVRPVDDARSRANLEGQGRGSRPGRTDGRRRDTFQGRARSRLVARRGPRRGLRPAGARPAAASCPSACRSARPAGSTWKRDSESASTTTTRRLLRCGRRGCRSRLR